MNKIKLSCSPAESGAKLASKDALLSKLSLTTRFVSWTAAPGDEGPRTSEDLLRHELDSLFLPMSLTTSLFSPVEQQSTVESRITLTVFHME